MDGAWIILGALLIAAVAFLLFCRARRARAERLARELLAAYFRGETSVAQLKQRARKATSNRFLHSANFFALAVTAFQSAVNDQLPTSHNPDDEKRLLGQLAALKTEFGLADLYRAEGWRAGRE